MVAVTQKREGLDLNDLDSALEDLLRRAQDPRKTPTGKRESRQGDPERDRAQFWTLVSMPQGDQGCWHWTGGKRTTGEGRFWGSDNRLHDARRMAFELVRGDLSGKSLRNHCPKKDRLCINPNHWEPITHQPRARVKKEAPPEKTFCIRGHAFTPENTYTPGDGYPRCLQCIRDRSAKRYQQSLELGERYASEARQARLQDEEKARQKRERSAQHSRDRRQRKAEAEGRVYRPLKRQASETQTGSEAYAAMIGQMSEEERREYIRRATERGVNYRRKRRDATGTIETPSPQENEAAA